MQIIADLQLHSRFSRAVSKDMTIPNIAMWAKRKGIGLVATGDWTHPMWMREIKRDLEEMGNGLLRLKHDGALVASENFDPSSVSTSKHPSDQLQRESESGQNFVRSPRLKQSSQFLPPVPSRENIMDNPLFLLATEVSCIYSHGGKGHRVHTLIWVPTLESADKISKEMTKQGCNLLSDGRPIIGLSNIQVAELVFTIEPKALVIPAHAWTPWFSVFGSMSGFDSLADSFGKFADHIYAVETGLSSNPSMNWQIKELDTRAIVSFSDAHSGPKIGREATVFEIPDGKLSYDAIYQAICGGANRRDAGQNLLDPLRASPGSSRITCASQDSLDSISETVKRGKRSSQILSSTTPPFNETRNSKLEARIAYTIEFYPEEGKYHYTGHRACNIRWGPKETKEKGTTCPVCGKPLTQGVVQRVEELAGRSEDDLRLAICDVRLTKDGPLIRMTKSEAFPNRPPFFMLVPLQEIISECIGSPVTSTKTQTIYTKLTDAFDGEFSVLLHTTKVAIEKVAGNKVALGIEKARTGDIVIDPGYDGVFGVVKIWGNNGESLVDPSKEQLRMF
jgi:PHP family Zn ribbon phosphoesterase